VNVITARQNADACIGLDQQAHRQRSDVVAGRMSFYDSTLFTTIFTFILEH
jgi:hypothetical protein